MTISRIFFILLSSVLTILGGGNCFFGKEKEIKGKEREKTKGIKVKDMTVTACLSWSNITELVKKVGTFYKF